MATFSEIYDVVESIVTTTLTSHIEIKNPYKLEQNAELSFNAAYGIAISSGDDVSENLRSGQVQRQREFIIHLTRRKFATSGDRATMKSTEKALVEDWTLLADAITANPSLLNATTDNTGIQDTTFGSDPGIEFVSLEKSRDGILVISTVLTVKYEASVSLLGC